MDINQFDVVANAEKGFKLYFENPYKLGEELPIFMTILGADSKVYKKAKRAQQLEILNENMGKQSKTTAADLDRMEEDNIEILTQLVIGLGETEETKETKTKPSVKTDTDFMLDDGKEYKCTKRDVKHLLTKFPWMRDQVSMAVQKRANFLA